MTTNEKSALLQPIPTSINSGRSHVGSYDEEDNDDNAFPSIIKRRDSFSQIKKVIHNDPQLLREYESENVGINEYLEECD